MPTLVLNENPLFPELRRDGAHVYSPPIFIGNYYYSANGKDAACSVFVRKHIEGGRRDRIYQVGNIRTAQKVSETWSSQWLTPHSCSSRSGSSGIYVAAVVGARMLGIDINGHLNSSAYEGKIKELMEHYNLGVISSDWWLFNNMEEACLTQKDH